MDVPLFLWRNPKLSDKDPHYIKMDKNQESRSMESGDLE